MIPVVLGNLPSRAGIADYLLSPYLIASRVQLSVWVMFANYAFGYLFGFVGLSLRCRSPPDASSSVFAIGNICSRPDAGRLPAAKIPPRARMAEVGSE